MLSNSTLVNVTRQGDALTDNGALTNSTSLDACVDLFFLAGACRTESETNIRTKLEAAYAENPLACLKIIFWAGNIRGGAGERRFFRLALKWLDERYADILVKNIINGNVEFYNRWDSLFELKNTMPIVLEYVGKHLEKCEDGLLGKWLPRRSQYNGFAHKLIDHMGISWKNYRKTIVALSDTVEQQMCNKEWSEINYSHVPSVAMNKYRKAFSRNDGTRFGEFIAAVKKGDAKINASAIFPYDVYRALSRGDNAEAVEAQWENLPNYMEGSTERILPMCDVSGSMAGLPLEISVSLGIYISERNEGIFKDAFLTFSSMPEMQYLQGTFAQRAYQLMKANWAMNTNLQACFDLILQKAVENNISQEEMPTKILIISDMEFDAATRPGMYSGYGRGDRSGVEIPATNFQAIEEKYAQAGYERPDIVFWNVNGRVGNVPVSVREDGTALISGASPSILKGVLDGSLSPASTMSKVINDKVYDRVVI